MYGQKRNQKDIKNKPLDEFITQTSNNLSEADEERSIKALKERSDPEAIENNEEGGMPDQSINNKQGNKSSVSDEGEDRE
jgi:hypothetical protein